MQLATMNREGSWAMGTGLQLVREEQEWRDIRRAGRRVQVHPNAFGDMDGTTFRKVDGVDMRLPSLGPRTEDQSSRRCGAEMRRLER